MALDFVITNAGLAAASVASPQGPFVYLPRFRLGNGTAPAQPTDVALQGSTVYQGAPSSFSYYDAQTIQINLEVPADAGPFDYGEIGIYTDNDTLFARFSYGALQHKESSLLTGYANVLRIKVLLRLSQGPSIFNIQPGDDQSVLEVATLNLVNTPSTNPENPIVIAHEPNAYQESVMLFKHDNTLWDPVNYIKVGQYTITGANANQLAAAEFAQLSMVPGSELGRFMIQTQGGYVRFVSSFSGTVANLASALSPTGLIGQKVAVYELTSAFASRIGARLTQMATVADVIAANPLKLVDAKVLHDSMNPWEIAWTGGGAGVKVSTQAGNLLQKLAVSDPNSGVNGLYVNGSVLGTVTNQYAILPGGLIIQWGRVTLPASDGGSAIWNFPIAFPTEMLAISITPNDVYGVAGWAMETLPVFNGTFGTTNIRIINRPVADEAVGIRTLTPYLIVIGR